MGMGIPQSIEQVAQLMSELRGSARICSTTICRRELAAPGPVHARDATLPAHAVATARSAEDGTTRSVLPAAQADDQGFSLNHDRGVSAMRELQR
eukprot:6101651-Pyramimonas_sp.AAC.1